MIPRIISNYLTYVASKFPVVSITGPRQSGKTTLARTLFPHKPYVSLEDIDIRSFALNDPRGFLNSYESGAIIDEVQYAPDLFSYIQTRVDLSQKEGEFILTGSQNFLLSEKISQSLAGRAAITELLPFSYKEIKEAGRASSSPFEMIYKGFYPRLYDRDIDPLSWYKSYIKTYVERDLRQLTNIIHLKEFDLFLRLCAGRIGQLINLSSLSIECGVSHNTIKQWLSILEASYIIFFLKPHYKNFNKRLVKQEKLYFYDTGLASYLLGIQSAQDLILHYMKGSLFENYVIAELMKTSFNQGQDPHLYFWRDNHGHEIDALIEKGTTLLPIEIKGGQTLSESFFKGLRFWLDLSSSSKGYLIYAGEEAQKRSEGIEVLSWQDVDKIVASQGI